MGFAADLNKLCKAAGDKADLVVRRTALDLHSQMIERTPVDTGRAKGSWQVGIGMIDSSEGSPDLSGNGTIERGNSRISKWEAGQSIYLTLSLPYAARLENGWSKQSPNGMVRLTVQNYSKAVADAVRQLK